MYTPCDPLIALWQRQKAKKRKILIKYHCIVQPCAQGLYFRSTAHAAASVARAEKVKAPGYVVVFSAV